MTTLTDTNNNLYALYMRSILNLAQSITIKFDQVAQATNLVVLQKTGILTDPNDRTAWKYYQNISGQYHLSDTPMTVYSLDAEISISFDVATLANHPITANAYAYGSTYYIELVATYPEQELLILGILYPTNKAAAIAAPDGTILSYPPKLVEANELDFIALLQSWIYAYLQRWVIYPFSVTDDLYPATYLAQLYLHLVPIIANLRLAACKTNQAHSFHIKQYLRSHGFLDVYLNELTHKQALNMYRNINYYERHAGFETTFNTLVDVLMTQVGLPVYAYEMRHNVEGLIRSDVTTTEHLQATALFKRRPINAVAEQYPISDYALSEVLSAMATATPRNDAYQKLYQADIEKKIGMSIDAQLSTKVIECSLNPIAILSQQVPDAILFNHWLVLAANDKYSVPVEYTPQGSKNPIRLTHQQAVAVWAYAISKALQPLNRPSGYTPLTRVPLLTASRVTLDPKPAKSVLLAIVDQQYVPASAIDAIYATAVTTPSTVPSLIAFTNYCQTIYNANAQQYQLVATQGHPYARAQLQGASDAFYGDVTVKLSACADATTPTLGMLYTTLLQQVGLNVADYRPIDFYNMAIAIYDAATGSSLQSLLDPANIQDSMIKLLSYLSSYSIQIVTSGLSDLRTVVPRPLTRIYNFIENESSAVRINEIYASVQRIDINEAFNASTRLPVLLSTPVLKSNSVERGSLDLMANTTSNYRALSTAEGRYSIGIDTDTTFDQDTLYGALSPSQRQAVVNMWRLNN